MLGCNGGAFREYLETFGWVVMEEPKAIFGDLWLEWLESCGWGVIEEPPGYIWCPVVGL